MNTAWRVWLISAVCLPLKHVKWEKRGSSACSLLPSADSPLLWIRIDPDMAVLRRADSGRRTSCGSTQLRYGGTWWRSRRPCGPGGASPPRVPARAHRRPGAGAVLLRVRMAACFCLAKVRLAARRRARPARARETAGRTASLAAAFRLPWLGWSPLPFF